MVLFLGGAHQGKRIDSAHPGSTVKAEGQTNDGMSCSVQLRKRSCHRMGPALHFRLLLVLCNDVASGSALRAEFQARIDEATHLSTQHRQLLIEVSYSAAPSYCNSMAVLMHCCSLLVQDCPFLSGY